MSRSKELREKRAKVFEQAKALTDKARSEGRSFNAEERAQFDRQMAEMDELKVQYEAEERVAQAERELSEEIETRSVRPTPDPKPEAETRELHKLQTDEYRNSYYGWMTARRGRAAAETRDLEVGTDSEGGYVTPEIWDRTVREKTQQINIMRQLATVEQRSNLTKFATEGNLGAHAIVAEEGDASATSEVSFGQRSIDAFKYVRLIKVSEELLADAFIDVPEYLSIKFATSLANGQEADFIAGVGGATEPDGLFVRADAGVTAASPTAITSDELIDLYHSLADQYRRNAVFITNDSTVKLIRKLLINSESGNYVWQPGLQAGQPDTLLGRPLWTSPAAPAATAGNRSVFFGDVSHYLIIDRVGQAGQTLRRLDELYSETGQIGFKHIFRSDGDFLITEAGKVLTMAAS